MRTWADVGGADYHAAAAIPAPAAAPAAAAPAAQGVQVRAEQGGAEEEGDGPVDLSLAMNERESAEAEAAESAGMEVEGVGMMGMVEEDATYSVPGKAVPDKLDRAELEGACVRAWVFFFCVSLFVCLFFWGERERRGGGLVVFVLWCGEGVVFGLFWCCCCCCCCDGGGVVVMVVVVVVGCALTVCSTTHDDDRVAGADARGRRGAR